MQLRLYLRDQLVRDVETELQNRIISNMIKVVDQFEAMVVLRRDRFQLIIILVEGISAALTAGDDFNVGQRLEMVDNSIEMFPRHPAVKHVLAGADHPAAVFGDKGDLMGHFGEEGDKLVILVTAGDDEADALLAHPLILGEEALTVIGFGIAQKGAVHVYRNHFDAH